MPTVTIYGSTSDAYGYQRNTAYSAVHDDTSAYGTIGSSNYIKVGQYTDSTYFYIYRSYIYFDTSSIPVGAVITSARLSLRVYTDSSDTDFDVVIQNGQPNRPQDPPDNTDFYYGYYSGDGGSVNTSSASVGSYLDIPLNSTGISWINKGGETKFCLRSRKDIDSIAPTDDEYIWFSSADSRSYPILEITYVVTASESREGDFGLTPNIYREGDYGLSIIASEARETDFGLEDFQKYTPILVKINGTDARDIVRVITITDNRFNEIDECVVETKSLEELPSYINTDAINEIEVWYSNADLLFAGYFYPPDKTPKHNVLNNIYTFKALSWLDKFKRIRVTKTFDGYTASQIVKALVEEYAPDFSTEYVDNNTTVLHLTFDRQTLYDCIDTVASLVQWNFWIDDNKIVHFVDLVNQSHSGVTIDDEHFIAAEGFTKYDYSQLFNKVVVKGGQALSELQYKDWYGDGSTTRFKVSYIEFENLLVKMNGIPLAGGFYGKDDFSTKEYLLDTDTKEIIFETAPSSSDHIEVWYQFIYTPVYTYEDQESIEKWGILEAEPITQPSVTDVNTLKYIGKVFVDTHKDPKVVGKIVVRDTQLSKMIYAGNYIDVDLSRYYTGTIQIDKIIHTITPTKHELQILQRPQRDLYRTLADIFDKIESHDLRLNQMEGSQVLQTTKSVTDTLTLSDSATIETPSLPYYIEDFDENIGLVEVEATSEQLNN